MLQCTRIDSDTQTNSSHVNLLVIEPTVHHKEFLPTVDRPYRTTNTVGPGPARTGTCVG